MEITYKTKSLKKVYNNIKEAKKKYNKQIAEKLFMRINQLQNIKNLDDFSKIRSARLHPLKGERKDQFGINLTGKFRLIIKANTDEVELIKIESVNVEDIIDYH